MHTSTGPSREDALRLHREGKLAEAEAIYRELLERQSKDAELLHLLGALCQQKGASVEAITCFEKALAQTPDAVDTLFNLGAVLHRLGKYEAAADAYRRVLTLAPEDIDSNLNLGDTLLLLGRLDEAAAVYRTFLAKRPENAGAHYNLGLALMRAGRCGEAVAAYEAALERRPDFVEARTNLAATLLELGEIEKAEAGFRQIVKTRPEDARAHLALSRLTTFREGDGAIHAMERALANPSLPKKEATLLRFALGKAYEDTGKYDLAFDCFEKANQLKRESAPHGTAADEERFERIPAIFNKRLLTEKAGHGFASEQPIFVLGMPRSGISLVEQILASHPAVFGGGALDTFPEQVRKIPNGPGPATGFPEAAAGLDANAFERLGRAYVETVGARAPGAARITDSLASNFQYIGLIHLALPQATILHCARNPIDTCLSCFKTYFAETPNCSDDLAGLGRYYRRYERLMHHWRAMLPGRILDIPYEDLVADQEGTTRRILDFCKLPWEDACLTFFKTKRPVHAASIARVRRPIDTAAVRRWRHYEHHLAPLLEAL